MKKKSVPQMSKRRRDMQKFEEALSVGASGVSPRMKKCPTGKRGYADVIEAKIVIAYQQNKDKQWRGKTEKRCYECELCRQYHLTSQKVFRGA